MKSTYIVLVAAFCAALVNAGPLPGGQRLQSEALDRLMVVEADNEAALRSKRTIGILRELFPDVSQMIEQKVNAIVAEVIRVLGPTLLRNVLGNNQQTGGGATVPSDGSTVTVGSPFGDDDDEDDANWVKSTDQNGSRVSVNLPTFPPDENEDTATTTTSLPPEGETTTDSNSLA